MKIPLRFQITEFDCGTVTLQNAISYLFERENIPAEIIRAISLYTLDCYDSKGNIGQGGTSKEAISMMTNWITNYTNSHDFKLKADHYLSDDVTFDLIKNNLNEKSCIVLRTYQNEEHYVLITKIDADSVYIFDPYYLEENYYGLDNKVEIIFDKPFDYNRKVLIERFDTETYRDFALGPIENRECLVFSKID